MRETTGPASGYTLEDVIRRHAQQPTKEMLESLFEARNIIQDCQLVSILGLNNSDSVLLHSFIAERVVKTRLYDLQWIVHSPEFLSTKKQVLKDDLKRINLETSLTRLSLGRDEITGESYTDEKSRLRVRNLELAANDLVARGSVYVEGKNDPRTEIDITNDLLEAWTLRWKDKFNIRHGHARQKFLRYKK